MMRIQQLRVWRRFASVGPEASASADESLFVRNLPRDATAEKVRRLFEGACKVRGVKVPMDRVNGYAKGHAYVIVAKDDAEIALAKMHGARMGDWDKRTLDVERADVAEARARMAASVKAMHDIADRDKGSLKNLSRKIDAAQDDELPFFPGFVTPPFPDPDRIPMLPADVLQPFVEQNAAADARRVASARGLTASPKAKKTLLRERGPAEWYKDYTGAKSTKEWCQAAWDESALTVPPVVHANEFEATLFVKNLPHGIDADDVRRAFEKAGHVYAIRMPLDQKMKPKGYAFVTVSAALSFNIAKAMDGTALRYKRLSVERATSANVMAASAEAKRRRPVDKAKINKTISRCVTAQGVLRVFEQQGDNFNHVNDATALHRIGRLKRTLQPEAALLFQKLQEHARSSLTFRGAHWGPRELASASWGLAKVGGETMPWTRELLLAISKVARPKVRDFKAQELSNVVWAFAKAGVAAPGLFYTIAQDASGKVETFEAQGLANTVWAFAKAGVSAPALFKFAATEAIAKVGTFNPQALTNTAWAYSKAGVSAPQLFQTIEAKAAAEMASFSPQNVSNIVWAFAKAGVEAPALFEAASVQARGSMGAFSAQDLGNTVWAFAKSRHADPELFAAIAAEAPAKMALFTPQNLNNTVWAFAKAGVEAPALFKIVADKAEKNIGDFGSQDLASIVWAFAKAGIEAPALFEAVALEAPKKIATFAPQALANTAWAFAKAGVEAPLLFESIADSSSETIETFEAQSLANVAWAFSKAGLSAPDLFQAVEVESSKKISTFTPQNLASTAWAFAKAGVEAPVFFQAATTTLSKKIATFNSQDLATTVWAYATAGLEAPALFEAVAAEASAKIATFNSQDLANTAWAFAKAGFEAPALFAAIAVESSKKMAAFNPQNLANTAWAFTSAGVDASELFAAVSDHADMAAFKREHLSQLHFVYNRLRKEAPENALTQLLSRHEAALQQAYRSTSQR